MKFKFLLALYMVHSLCPAADPPQTQERKMRPNIPSAYSPKTTGATTTFLLRFPSFAAVKSEQDSLNDIILVTIENLPSFHLDSSAERIRGEQLLLKVFDSARVLRPGWNESSDHRVLYKMVNDKLRSLMFLGEDNIWRGADIRIDTFRVSKGVGTNIRLGYQVPIAFFNSAPLIDAKITGFIKESMK